MTRTRWSNLARHGLLGTSLLGLASTPAVAERCDVVAPSTIAVVVGLDVSPKPRLIGGLEGRQCLSDGTEAMVRVEVGGGAPRLIGGVRARPFERADADTGQERLGVEAGASLDTASRFGLHLAATYGSHSAYLAVQTRVVLGAPPLPARFTVLGGLAPWTLQDETVVAGRPLLHGGRALRPALATVPTARSAEDRAARDHFASSAQLELSSVWTFLRLAAELAAVGAPPALVARALDAADDELRHAELCAAAAGGATLRPLPAWAAQPRFTTRSPRALATLAAEAWREGCLDETAAAEEARLVAAEADAPLGAMLAAIARDERGHAELSWAVLAWAFAIDGATTAAALASGPPPSTSRAAGGRGDAALLRRGLPSPQVTAAARAFAATSARARLATLA